MLSCRLHGVERHGVTLPSVFVIAIVPAIRISSNLMATFSKVYPITMTIWVFVPTNRYLSYTNLAPQGEERATLRSDPSVRVGLQRRRCDTSSLLFIVENTASLETKA